MGVLYCFLVEEFEPLVEDAEYEDLDTVDESGDRSVAKLYVGRKVRGVYTNGLFVGTISYFNCRLNKYCVDFEDGSSDYVTVNDFLTDNNLELLPIDWG